MDIVTLCNIFNFKCTKEVERNTKVKQLVSYINQNQIEYSEVGEKVISRDAFLRFLENINSIASAAKVLSEYKNLSAIGLNPELVAKFFNVYPPEGYNYPGSFVSELITDSEYLKLASIEWTNEHILRFSFDKILEVKGKRLTIKDNTLTEENELDYMPGTHQNVESLKTAKKNNILKRAIESLD
ncbi:MAG: hypothetical protein J6A15_08050 [Clostridia bacterium]|nr:hypothetical protein [Clostridia bacterium]